MVYLTSINNYQEQNYKHCLVKILLKVYHTLNLISDCLIRIRNFVSNTYLNFIINHQKFHVVIKL